MLWRKVIDHNPAFVDLTDKLAAKRLAKARVPELPVAQVLWVGKDPHALPEHAVHGDVVVKANHAWNTNVFVSDNEPGYREIVSKAKQWLAYSHHRDDGQWAYRDIPRRIFVEEALLLGGGNLPTDIKVHTYGSQIGHVWVDDKLGKRSRTYDVHGLPLDVRDSIYKKEEQALPDSPETRALVAEAIKIAPLLLDGLDYARVDFMVAEGKLYFGEFTLYPDAGYDRWGDPALTKRAEALWDLRRSDFFQKSHRGFARLYAAALRSAIKQSSWFEPKAYHHNI